MEIQSIIIESVSSFVRSYELKIPGVVRGNLKWDEKKLGDESVPGLPRILRLFVPFIFVTSVRRASCQYLQASRISRTLEPCRAECDRAREAVFITSVNLSDALNLPVFTDRDFLTLAKQTLPPSYVTSWKCLGFDTHGL